MQSKNVCARARACLVPVLERNVSSEEAQSLLQWAQTRAGQEMTSMTPLFLYMFVIPQDPIAWNVN